MEEQVGQEYQDWEWHELIGLRMAGVLKLEVD